MLASVVVIAGAYGIARATLKNTQNNDNKKCDDIKSLLEQKKKELEEAARNWPEEKIKATLQNKTLDIIKKDADAEKVIAAAENAKAHYDKLQSTIELLQKRYDLCMLSLPQSGAALYKGTIVKDSLSDPAILDKLNITKTYQAGAWTLVDVLVNKKQIEKLGQSLADGPWYMHFWQEKKDDVIVAFRDRSFNIIHSDQNTWAEAINHGTSKGIPKEQLDFKIKQ